MTDSPEITLETMGEGDVTVRTHWGWRRPDGGITWDPTYGTGTPDYYTEERARAKVKAEGGSVVTRTETTVTVLSKWVADL